MLSPVRRPAQREAHSEGLGVTNPAALTMEHPLDLDDARRAARRLAELRRDAEQHHEDAIKAAAKAEADYRRAFARAIVSIEGRSAVEREAVAREQTAQESYERDLKLGLAKAAQERLRGLEGERSMLKSLIEWSARLDPSGAVAQAGGPDGQTFGGRRAA